MAAAASKKSKFIAPPLSITRQVEKRQARYELLGPVKRLASENSKDIYEIVNTYKSLLEKYAKYYDINLFYLRQDIGQTGRDAIKVAGREKWIASGNTKTVSKIMLNGAYYAITSVVSVPEYETHLQMLCLYYETLEEHKWLFKIPRLYPIFYDLNVYLMDYVELCDDDDIKVTDAKNDHMFPVHIRNDIGKFLGMFARRYNKVLYDFEIYLEHCGSAHRTYTILDFGNYIGVNGVKGTLDADVILYNSVIYDAFVAELDSKTRRSLTGRLVRVEGIQSRQGSSARSPQKRMQAAERQLARQMQPA